MTRSRGGFCGYDRFRAQIDTASVDAPSRRVVLCKRLAAASTVAGGVLLVLLVPPAYAADCNLNGTDDARDVATGASEDCNQNGFPDECESSRLQFNIAPGIAVGSVPTRVEVADLNRDGVPDLVVAATSGFERRRLTVLLRDGSGTLERSDYDLGSRIRAFRMADVDGDGRLDVVSVDQTVARILPGRDDGTFGPTFTVPTPWLVDAVDIGDITGDGRADIVVAGRAARALAVIAQEDGGDFDSPQELALSGGPAALVIEDLDGDGDQDIAIAQPSTREVAVLRRADDGTFAIESIGGFDGGPPQSLLATDLTDDGRAELVVTSNTTFYVVANSGGELDAVRSYPLGARFVTPADIDQDGAMDLVAVTWSGTDATVFLGDGMGWFTTAAGLGLDARGSTTTSNAVAVTDLDRDGRIEIIVSAPVGRGLFVLTQSDVEAVNVEVVAEDFPVDAEPHSATLGDIDGDGDLDVVTGDGGFGQITLLANDGEGAFTRLRSYPAPGYAAAIDLADFDRDGDLDIVVADSGGSTVRVLLNNGNRGYSQQTPLPTGRQPFFLTAEDYSGDGVPDILSANSGSGNVSLIAGRGDGTFLGQELVTVGGSPRGVALGDFDGDGASDLAVASDGLSQLILLSGVGDGSFVEGRRYGAQRPSSIVAADFDGDGDDDLAVASEAVLAVFMFQNTGDGIFEPPWTISLGSGPFAIAAPDLSSDGFPDLVTANQSTNSVSVLINSGGTFGLPFEYAVGTDPRAALAGDLDGDGDTDLVSANHTSEDITVLLNTTLSTHLETICLEVDFYQVAAPSARPGPISATTKYVLPVDPDDPSLLPAVFQNVRVYPLHQEFLARIFPEQFPDLSADAYDRLFNRRATRTYYAGVIFRVDGEDGPFYGFNVLANYFADPDEVPTVDEVRRVYEGLSESFTLRPLAYYPDDPLVREVTATWENQGFPVRLDNLSEETFYEPYTRGVGYGRVRILTQAEFEAANETGQLGFQDILVLERAPRDIQGVVAGVITAERQGELSHVAIRTARRGTPNAFVADAANEFSAYAGELVRLEVREAEYLVEPATSTEAEAWWEANRPQLSVLPAIDAEFDAFLSLEEIAAGDLAGEGTPMESRFGGKATNLARLQPLLEGEFTPYRERGFGIPVRYYLEFMRSNSMTSALDGARDVTYEEYLAELFASARFQSDSAFRFATLAALREHIREQSTVDPELVQRLAAHIVEVFGTSTSRVRFRSSSNAEDAIEFNGAGLYESTSVCAADDLDLDARGPSHCDPERENERGIARGLKRVWASLWNFGAFEERAFYGIPQDLAAMGILVNRAFIDERVNGVAFTGNLTSSADRRYVVTAQVGENSVVSPDPGELPEMNLLEVEDGRVVEIVRATRSTLAEGMPVMSDAQLEELGALLWHLDRDFPVDTGSHRRQDILLDVEFKIEASGDLAVKQVRPFLVTDAAPPPPTFELEIPPGLEVCGSFVPFRAPADALSLKSTVTFREGRITLPTRDASFEVELFADVALGAAGQLASREGPGTMTVQQSVLRGETIYRFDYRQEYTLATGEALELRLSNLTFGAGVDAARTRRLDQALESSDGPSLQGRLERQDDSPLVDYRICPPDTLRLWTVEVETEDGSFLHLEERHDPPPTVNDTGPASLVRARLDLRGGVREVSDYWRLVYTAGRHNRNVVHWIVLEPPAEIAGIARPVRVVEVVAPEPLPPEATEAVRFLDEDLVEVASPDVVAYRREESVAPASTSFVRGDVSADGRVNLTDAVRLLDHLFRAGPRPGCAQAADANADDRLNLADPVAILLHAFGGAGDLPAPFPACGVGPRGELDCAVHAACE